MMHTKLKELVSLRLERLNNFGGCAKITEVRNFGNANEKHGTYVIVACSDMATANAVYSLLAAFVVRSNGKENISVELRRSTKCNDLTLELEEKIVVVCTYTKN